MSQDDFNKMSQDDFIQEYSDCGNEQSLILAYSLTNLEEEIKCMQKILTKQSGAPYKFILSGDDIIPVSRDIKAPFYLQNSFIHVNGGIFTPDMTKFINEFFSKINQDKNITLTGYYICFINKHKKCKICINDLACKDILRCNFIHSVEIDDSKNKLKVWVNRASDTNNAQFFETNTKYLCDGKLTKQQLVYNYIVSAWTNFAMSNSFIWND